MKAKNPRRQSHGDDIHGRFGKRPREGEEHELQRIGNHGDGEGEKDSEARERRHAESGIDFGEPIHLAALNPIGLPRPSLFLKVSPCSTSN